MTTLITVTCGGGVLATRFPRFVERAAKLVAREFLKATMEEMAFNMLDYNAERSVAIGMLAFQDLKVEVRGEEMELSTTEKSHISPETAAKIKEALAHVK